MLPAHLRTLFLPACLAAMAVLVVSFHLENTLGLVPCPLCFSQRLLLGLYALLCLAAVLQAPGTRGTLRYARVALGCSLAGAVLAARHVWLQGAHGVIHMCPAPIGRVFEQSWAEAARQLLLGGRLQLAYLELSRPDTAGVEPVGLPAAGGAALELPAGVSFPHPGKNMTWRKVAPLARPMAI
jgi:disulfide bond formation protein DsbB